MEDVIKIQFVVPKTKHQEIEALMKKIGVETKKDLFNNALTILEWAVRESSGGRIIASVDEKNKKYKELVMPVLSAAASSNREGLFD